MSLPSRSVVVLVGAVLLAGYGLGFLSRHLHVPPYRAVWNRLVPGGDSGGADGRPDEGKWFRARTDVRNLAPETLERLSSLGYLGGYESPSGLEHVTVYDPEAAENGLNLYNSGHGPEAFLIDMQGTVLHRWSYPFEKAFPSHPDPWKSSQWWRRVHVYPDGGLLAIFEGQGLIRLDRESNLLWARAGGFHHEAIVVETDGTILALSREERILERIHPTEPVLEDLIVALDPDGNTLRQVSVLEAFEKSAYRPLLNNLQKSGDILHTNTLEILRDVRTDDTPFRNGHALISLRNLHAIATVDLDEGKVVWALTGMWAFQHDPTLLPNGNMLLFDNAGEGDASKIMEFDPLSQKTVWIYRGVEERPFFSATLGSCQRLPNGNTLITESEAGRAFESTPDKRIVWEFHNPALAGEDDEFIATLFEVVRLPSTFGSDWLETPPAD